uniref:J domain-containing protein n=1 Tax=Davidia involucrata TaxID=16924 RepID=A0A5B6ZFA4_DAVIN
MSPAVVDFRSSITSPQQMQSKQPPSSLQNPNSKPHIPFDFGPFPSNNLPEQRDSKAANSSNLGDGSDGGFNCDFSSPLVSRVSSEKSNLSAFSGRSRPRLVKQRKQLGSLYGRSTSDSAQNESGFNPFRSVSETSDRVEDATITSYGFGASTGDVKFGKFDNVGFVFGADKSNVGSSSNSEQRESGEIVGQSSADEFGKFDNLGFVFGANKSSSISNLNVEKTRYSESTGQWGANVGFMFGANKSNLVPNSKSEQRESNGTGHTGADEFGKFNNVGFVFGANKSNSVSNSKSEQTESNGSAGHSATDKFGKFVFSADKSGSILNSNMEKREYSESAVEPGANEFAKFEDIGNFFDERGKMKEENKAEFRKLNNADFVFSANHGDSVSYSNAEKKESSENVGKSAPDVRGKMKLDVGADFGNLDNVGFVFGQSWSDLRSNSTLENRESSENVEKSVSTESGRMKSGVQLGKFDNVGFVFGTYQSGPASDFQKATPDGVSIFGSSSKKSSSFRESTKLSDEMNKVNGDNSGNCSGFAKTHNLNLGSDVNSKCNFVFGGSISTATASDASPVHKLSDEMKNLNVHDYEKVDDSNKTTDFNVSSCANVNNIFLFGSNKKASGSSTGSSGTTSCNQIKNSKFEGPGSGSTVEKTEKLNLKTSDKDTSVFTDIKVTACSFGGAVENMMPNEMKNKTTRSGVGTLDGQLNLGCPSPMERQQININEKNSDDSSVGVSTPNPFAFQAGLDKSSDGPRDQLNDDVKMNKASFPSFLSFGLGFDAPSTGRVENKDKFSFTSMPDFRTPNLDVSCSFTVNLFPGLNKKLEFSASKKKRGKSRHAILVQQQTRQDHVSEEGSSQQNPESPPCYSPMDFSPYQDNNCAPSGGSSIVSTHAKDEDLAAAREGADINEGDNKCREPNEKGSDNHCERIFGVDYPLEEFVSGAETECTNTKTEQVSFNSGAGVAEAGPGVGSNMKKEESECKKPFCFASGLEDTGKRDFIFSVSSAQDNLSAAKRQYRKKYRMKVGRGSNCTSLNREVEFASSSVQSSPRASTTSHLKVAHDKKGEISNSQSKGENKSKADVEHVKQESTTAATRETCEKWRSRGNQAYKNGDLSKALEFYTKGVNSFLHSNTSGCCLEPLVLCYSNRAATRMSLGRMREALGDCTMAAELDPNFFKVQIRAAKCHLALGEVENALQYFNKCLESGRDVCLDKRIIIEAADGLQKAQKVAERTNQCAELLQQRTSNAATTALGIIAEVLPISSYSEKLLEMKGEALFTLRKYEEVIQMCEQTLDFAEKNFVMIDADGDLADGDGFKYKNSFVRLWRWHLMSKSHFHLGRLEMALNLLEKQELFRSTKDSMTQGSSIPLAVTVRELLHHKNAGNEAFQLGRHIEAVEHYTAATSSSVESRPFAAICFCNRAAAHQALGQIADAIADCSLAIALDGNYTKAVSRRATLHETIRDYEQAASDLQRFISVLDKQSKEKVQQSGTPDGPTGSSVKELRRARRRLSSVEEKAKRGTSLDLYLILGIKASDTASEIKKAYRKAALRHHPDKAGQFLTRSESGDDGRLWKEIAEEVHNAADRLFKMVGEAYAVLSDPNKRSEYDLQEEVRKLQKESNGSSASRRPSDFYSSPFESSGNRRYWQESWRTYGNSRSRW